MTKAWRQYRITCASCGETVLRNNKSETCSLKCRSELRRQRRDVRSPTAECPGCGQIALLPMTAAGLAVCSQRCRAIIWSRRRSKRDWQAYFSAAAGRRAGLGSERPCAFCGSLFVVRRYDHKFCSMTCNDRWAVKFGRKGQTRRTKNADKRARRDAEIGACSLCGISHENIVPARELGITRRNASGAFHKDHIIPKSKGGGDEYENTRYLCWFCNLARMDMRGDCDPAIAAAGRAFWATISSL